MEQVAGGDVRQARGVLLVLLRHLPPRSLQLLHRRHIRGKP